LTASVIELHIKIVTAWHESVYGTESFFAM